MNVFFFLSFSLYGAVAFVLNSFEKLRHEPDWLIVNASQLMLCFVRFRMPTSSSSPSGRRPLNCSKRKRI